MTEVETDVCIELILHASRSGLRYYDSTTKKRLRKAMRDVEEMVLSSANVEKESK